MRNSRSFSATRGGTNFEELTAQLGPALQLPMVGRGTAYADFDNDGDVGLLFTSNNGSPRLLRNANGNQNNVLRLKTISTRSNHDGMDATLTRKSVHRRGQLPIVFFSYGLTQPFQLTVANPWECSATRRGVSSGCRSFWGRRWFAPG